MSSGGMSSTLGKLDPLGNKITQWGGDPLNLYGNQNNPNAAFFPQGSPGSSAPGVLPNLGAGSLMPRPPQGAFQGPTMGGGQFNSMAAQLAGPLFNPAVQASPAVNVGRQPPNMAVLLQYLRGGMSGGR